MKPFYSRKDIFLCCSSSVLLALSFPVFDIEVLAWISFIPLFLCIEGKSPLRAFLLAYISGAVFWLCAIYWLVHVTAAGVFLLIAYLSIYWGLFGLAVSVFMKARGRLTALFAAASSWVLLEFIRSYLFTGFPWALLGYSQFKCLPVIQFSDITGAWGVSFLLILVNYSLFQVLTAVLKKRPVPRTPVIIVLLFLFAAVLYGVLRRPAVERTLGSSDNTVKVSVVQGNIPQELKWDERARDFIFERYVSLTERAAAEEPDLIVWPEAAVPVVLSPGTESFSALSALSSVYDVNLLAGSVTSRGGEYYNSAVLFGPRAETYVYDKLHLVPFGEYIPLRKVFGFLETVVPIGEMTAGSSYRVFSFLTKAGRKADFAALICFEDVFPELSREFVKRGAVFLAVITNDAWYQRTSAAYQHMQASVFRAVENRVPVVRSANTGVSCFIGPGGKIERAVQDGSGGLIFTPGYITSEIALPVFSRTVYNSFGDWFVAVCLAIFVISVFRACAVPCVPRRR